jgi:tRNA A37 methylthiotransferase MiaB
VDDLADLADEVMAQRAAARIGETAEVLIEESLGRGRYVGRAAHQAPEVDGTTTVRAQRRLAPGDMVTVRVTGSDGVDLDAEALAGRPAVSGRAGGRRPAEKH